MNLFKNTALGLFLVLMMTCFHSYGQTQSAMNAQAYANYQKANKDLNVVYQKILKEYSTQTEFIKNIKVAQRLWIQLRDADLAAKFPESGSYGTVEPMCRAAYLENLTKERIKFLKTWVDGLAEGEACNGSVKFK